MGVPAWCHKPRQQKRNKCSVPVARTDPPTTHINHDSTQHSSTAAQQHRRHAAHTYSDGRTLESLPVRGHAAVVRFIPFQAIHPYPPLRPRHARHHLGRAFAHRGRLRNVPRGFVGEGASEHVRLVPEGCSRERAGRDGARRGGERGGEGGGVGGTGGGAVMLERGGWTRGQGRILR